MCITLRVLVIVIYIKYKHLKLNIKEISHQIRYISSRDTQVQIKGNINNAYLKDIVNDANELKAKYQEMEESLIKKDKLFRETITNISHDIRTPLAITTGYLQMLEEEKLTEEQKEYVGIAKDRMKYLKELLEQLFEFVRIEADEIPLEFKIINIYNILRDIIAMYYNEYEQRGGIKYISIPNQPCLIWGDENCIKRIISNVISNSFIHGDGEYSIIAETQTDICSIRIANQSQHISQEDIKFIFDRLYTTDKSRSAGRTGLGLAIAKRMVEKHNGNIMADYEKTNGIFTINIEFPVMRHEKFKETQ